MLHCIVLFSAKDVLSNRAYEFFRVFALYSCYMNLESVWHDEWTLVYTARWIVAEVLIVEILLQIF